MSSEKIIEVSNLTKYYGELLAVSKINFTVKRGEIFGFLGPNGAGKTTTINILTGLTKPTSGKTLTSGSDVTSEPIKAKEQVGVVPGISGLYDEMTAQDNINFSAKLHSVPKEKRVPFAQELLSLFGLYERRNDRVSTFSSGMKRRLMIATALVHDPEILFLDEPTTGLDVQSQRQIRGLIKKLNRRGTTVFLTTHYIEEADELCERIAIIDEGEIIAVDTPENLKTIVQADHVIEVTFDNAENITEELKGINYVREVTTVEDKYRLYVEEPSKALPPLFHFVSKNRLKVTSVNTLRPTLEDAFVELTGLPPEIMKMENEQAKETFGQNND